MMILHPILLLKLFALTLLAAQCAQAATGSPSSSSSSSSSSSIGHTPPSPIRETSSQRVGAMLGKAYKTVTDGTKAAFVYAPVAAAHATKDGLRQGTSSLASSVKGMTRGFAAEAKKPGPMTTRHSQRIAQRRERKIANVKLP